jgi:hypothetical protein
MRQLADRNGGNRMPAAAMHRARRTVINLKGMEIHLEERAWRTSRPALTLSTSLYPTIFISR